MLETQAASPALETRREGILARLKFYVNPVDGRYEDLRKGNLTANIFRDFTAGLIVAMVAIPLAMGFAMASGLRPEQGIVGGAVAGLVGALWGGSKYQVYGPTAAYIPVIAGLMAKYDHSMLVLSSIIGGVILITFGIARLGKIVAKVPHSIVVGFTIGIAATIALSQVGEILGLKARMPTHFFEKAELIMANLSQISIFAIVLGLLTFVLTKYLLKISVFLPAPLWRSGSLR
jgi:SulP family sulfate permease